MWCENSISNAINTKVKSHTPKKSQSNWTRFYRVTNIVWHRDTVPRISIGSHGIQLSSLSSPITCITFFSVISTLRKTFETRVLTIFFFFTNKGVLVDFETSVNFKIYNDSLVDTIFHETQSTVCYIRFISPRIMNYICTLMYLKYLRTSWP